MIVSLYAWRRPIEASAYLGPSLFGSGPLCAQAGLGEMKPGPIWDQARFGLSPFGLWTDPISLSGRIAKTECFAYAYPYPDPFITAILPGSVAVSELTACLLPGRPGL